MWAYPASLPLRMHTLCACRSVSSSARRRWNGGQRMLQQCALRQGATYFSDILFPSILMQQLSESLFLGAAARCFCNFVLYKSTRGNVGCLPCSNFSVATLKGSSRSVMSFMKTLLQLSISELPLSSMIFSISWNCVYADFSIPTLEFHCVLASWHTP